MVSDASWRKVYDILNDLRGWLLFTKLDLGLKPKIPRRSGKKINVKDTFFQPNIPGLRHSLRRGYFLLAQSGP